MSRMAVGSDLLQWLDVTQNTAPNPRAISKLAPSPRSGRKHKAWGASPRIGNRNRAIEFAKWATARDGIGLSPASRAQMVWFAADPGACAPGFMLPPASRARRLEVQWLHVTCHVLQWLVTCCSG